MTTVLCRRDLLLLLLLLLLALDTCHALVPLKGSIFALWLILSVRVGVHWILDFLLLVRILGCLRGWWKWLLVYRNSRQRGLLIEIDAGRLVGALRWDLSTVSLASRASS